MTHDDILVRGERWLRNTLNCGVVLRELRALTESGEIPDLIGWVNGQSIVVECKTSVEDYRADLAKPFRQPGKGMGTWRFYLTPPGLLSMEQLSWGWGWYEVRGRGVFCRSSFMYPSNQWPPFERNWADETTLLVSALRRAQRRTDNGTG